MPVRQRKPADSSSSNSKRKAETIQDKKLNTPHDSSMKRLIGFELADLRSYNRFVRLCSAPADPSSLAIFRIVFGLLMVFDCLHERRVGVVVSRWSDAYQVCRFPLINSLHPLPVAWMTILYLCMIIGAVGIAIGLFFRLSCLMYVLPYWYIFLLDKTVWNNHSYLFGLIASLLVLSDANRQWSLDAWRRAGKANAHIPVWQYGLFRFQVIIVYFIAGLKKLDGDWVQGYSMSSLSHAPIFDPFRYVLTDEKIDRYIVHLGGLIIDLTSGFLLYLDSTRWLGTAMVTSFHAMNATMFEIGQFPYVMLCTTAIFYAYDWPKKVYPSLAVTHQPCHTSKHCLYQGEKPRIYHHVSTFFTVVYMLWQCFLPYSHSLTPGYKNWSGSLYGYSWDMMVHNWETQHIKVKYMSRVTGQEGYLEPSAFVSTTRWSNYPDMVKQHASCIAEMLAEEYDIHDVEIYMDIWHSMNHRFQQRFIDPSIDLVRAPWSPFQPASFVLPLLNDLNDWRDKLKDLHNQALEKDADWFIHNPGVTFVADFPGMVLENFIHEDLSDTNITLLAGSAVLYNAKTRQNITLEANQALAVGSGTHKVYVTSEQAACYMYMYTNVTADNLESQLLQLDQEIISQGLDIGDLEVKAQQNETLQKLLDMKKEKEIKVPGGENLWTSCLRRIHLFYVTAKASVRNVYVAVECIISGEPMEDVLQTRYGIDPSPSH
ncbi:vitamin K-dependent gamma-carboxylase-like isoform X1 [Watersipora subatra]|uniref:vitamin K-dependent gamma-carboxylase-like isoform X1 n=1 Tax=Watersipora subatra TaxID=2589382 RepID=UPI00355C0552